MTRAQDQDPIAKTNVRNHLKKAVVPAIAVAALGLGISGNISGESKPQPAVAATESTPQQRATILANELTQAFNTPGHNLITDVPILNGVVTHNTKAGVQPSYRYPFLLTTQTPSPHLDQNGNFLQGAWLGIQGNDAEGHVVITAVPYDVQANHFELNNPANITLPHTGVYSSVAEVGSDAETSELFAVDLQGNHTMTDQATQQPIHPGQFVGTK